MSKTKRQISKELENLKVTVSLQNPKIKISKEDLRKMFKFCGEIRYSIFYF
jgi:hypothetical protein